MKKLTVIFILFLLIAPELSAQFEEIDTNKLRPRYGLFARYHWNSHFADFEELPGVPSCCPKFENGSGTGFTLGLLYEYPVLEDLLLSGRIAYSRWDGKLTKEEQTLIILDGYLDNGKFEHEIDAKLTNIGLEIGVMWNFTRSFNLHGGFILNMASDYSFSQIERISEPERRGTYADSLGNDLGVRERAQAKGDLQDAAKLQAALILGISYDLPLNRSRSLLLSPEIFYSHGFTNIVKDINWTVSSVGFGLGIKYSPIPSIDMIDEFKYEKKIDTVSLQSYGIDEDIVMIGENRYEYDTSESKHIRTITSYIFRTDTLYSSMNYALQAHIIAVGVDSLGNEIPNPVFRIEEFLSSQMHPLLNYVFFEDNSSKFQSKYRLLNESETKEFNNASLNQLNTMDIYYNLLNIVGYRMQLHKDAKLTIVGCNSDIGNEKKNIGLSRNRAELVYNYLSDVWKIAPDRLKIEVRNLPEKFSTPIDEENKIAENRRVELYSDNYEILKYVLITDTARTVNPPIARFKPNIEAEAGLKMWDIKIVQENNILKDFSTSGYVLPNVDMNIDPHDWNIDADKDLLPYILKNLEYRLHVIDNKYQDYRTPYQYLPVKIMSIQKKRRERIADKVIDRYSLILFDFNKSDINELNRRVADFIKGRIEPHSTVKIEGYTDKTGDAAYNKNLSMNRARATAAAIGRNDASVNGYGEEVLLYGNDNPEGRFYCRTVNITVETVYK